ncbi:hypothetical protein [Cohaesibacter celericrescens]|nr:hypothetical protein [Cohaesibacter celericrescens]
MANTINKLPRKFGFWIIELAFIWFGVFHLDQSDASTENGLTYCMAQG